MAVPRAAARFLVDHVELARAHLVAVGRPVRQPDSETAEVLAALADLARGVSATVSMETDVGDGPVMVGDMRTPDVAAFLQITPQRAGRLAPRLGAHRNKRGHWRFPRAAVEAYREERDSRRNGVGGHGGRLDEGPRRPRVPADVLREETR